MTGQRKKRYVPAVGPGLRRLLYVVFALFALLGVSSVYLGSITALESATGNVYQNYFYQAMFLGHLVLGLLIVLPVILFGILHMRRAYDRPNRRAVRVGYALFATAIVLLASGIVLTRIENVIEVRDPAVRGVAYWAHVITPLLAVWLFILHRLAGPKIRWKVGLAWLAAAAGFAAVMMLFHAQDPRNWGQVGPESGERYFFPSLARTATGNFIPERVLNNDAYCVQCHEDIHASWEDSVHKFASFNNPVYLFSILEARQKMFERDGNVQGARFCAGCHDPVPFFTGAFDDPKFDDPDYDLGSDASAQAGITCTACHAITHINSPRGNSDFTIEEPSHYPFTFSDSEFLRWVNRQLVRSKPAFHKKTFLKPLHKTPEFCGSCHKVHLPVELNAYKWLRGQNHYDTYHLSGVSGHGASSFYYPPQAEHNCNGCHMPLVASNDFGAQDFDGSGELKVHGHQFPSANTAVPVLVGRAPEAVQAHRDFLEGVLRVDIFGIKEEGRIDGALTAPLRPEIPALTPGRSYLLETVIRTVKMGHPFTQGTSDSNEVWMELTAETGGRVVGRSGRMGPRGDVDPWSHFVNSFVLDREGNRLDRRNAADIFVALYNNQIPPGAADVVHYRLDVPRDASGELTVEVKLNFRKFDATLMRYVMGDDYVNDLPVTLLASDRVTFPIAAAPARAEPPEIPEWQRWNDYGIGLLRKGDKGANKGELRQAEDAFTRVAGLGRPDGPLNLARVYFKEGRLDDAVAALTAAAEHDPPAPVWTVLWFTGLVNKQNGFLDEAIANFTDLVTLDTAATRERGFDFSEDYRVLNELGQALFERSKQERGAARRAQRDRLLGEAQGWFERVLELDPENLTAHWNLALLHDRLGDAETAAHHRAQHARYKPDDNARDVAVARARQQYPAANHAAEAVVIYDLSRDAGSEAP